MYCLSQFCCLCFSNKVKLKLLREITCGNTTFIQIANALIPEIHLSETSHMSACEDCVNFVMDMHTFRRKCVNNNCLLVEYVKLLGSFGGKIGNAQVQLSNFTKIRTNSQMEDNITSVANMQQNINFAYIKLEDVKIENAEGDIADDGISSDLAKLDWNETATSDGTLEEEMEIKIEMNDEETNHDPLALLNEPVHSTELQGNDDSPNSPPGSSNEVAERRGSAKLHECKTCEKKFSFKSALKRHNRIHTGEKPYKCETCGKCYALIDGLKRHILSHTGERPHECKICKKTFVEKSNLKTHNMIHTGEKPYKCETCGKCFNTLSTLRKHSRIHTGEKPYECKTCGKCFTYSSNLSHHLTTHTREKPYECKTCGVCFALSSNLNKHVKIHTGEKPYECDICGKCFAQKCSFKYHMSDHRGETPHKCKICGKCFPIISRLNSHTLSVHGEEKTRK